MKDNGMKMKLKDWEKQSTVIEVIILVNGRQINFMAKEDFSISQELIMRDIGILIHKMEEELKCNFSPTIQSKKTEFD